MNKEFMKEAINASKNDFTKGGPFGAVIVKDNKIIATSSNSVIKNNDPTAHAEINAIRKACEVLNTHDLTDCDIYTSCYPCPMCLSAILWANIKNVYYANTKQDAASIGFRDDFIYNLIADLNNGIQNPSLNLVQLDKDEALKVFDEYKNSSNKKNY